MHYVQQLFHNLVRLVLGLSMPLKVSILQHEVNKPFEVQCLNISGLFEDVDVDLLD